MNREIVDEIVRAVLYEGHLLYPYRPSSLKNRQRFTFGRVYPKAFSALENGRERWTMTTECLLDVDGPDAEVEVVVKFLQPIARTVRDGSGRVVERLKDGDSVHYSWPDAAERTIELPAHSVSDGSCIRREIVLPESTDRKALENGGSVERLSAEINGWIDVTWTRLEESLYRLRAVVANESALDDRIDQDSVLLRTLTSTHAILHARSGEFVSLMDPTEPYAPYAASCDNDGCYPVLVGEEGDRDTMLSSPIILYDYPKIAPESAGDLFDSTEIDELLTLRIMTMTDGEKDEMRSADEFARQILQRAESFNGNDLFSMHGTIRDMRSLAEEEAPDHVIVDGRRLEVGDRVTIRPRGRSDIMDMALDGRTASIEAIEQDFEDRLFLALVVDDDPGKDLGMMRQPGHRFFYGIDEVEPAAET